jgi:hypothetical protein
MNKDKASQLTQTAIVNAQLKVSELLPQFIEFNDKRVEDAATEGETALYLESHNVYDRHKLNSMEGQAMNKLLVAHYA